MNATLPRRSLLLRMASPPVALLLASLSSLPAAGAVAGQQPAAPPTAAAAEQAPGQAAGPAARSGPQVVHPGAMYLPIDVLNPQNQWSALLPVLSTPDADILIEDVSNPTWLQANAEAFLNKGQYTVTVVTFYKTRRHCRTDQVASGFSDAAHIDACNNIRYRVREVDVDVAQSVVTLRLAAMVWSDGTLDTASLQQETRSRGIAEMDAGARKAIGRATDIIAAQARSYDRRQQNY